MFGLVKKKELNAVKEQLKRLEEHLDNFSQDFNSVEDSVEHNKEDLKELKFHFNNFAEDIDAEEINGDIEEIKESIDEVEDRLVEIEDNYIRNRDVEEKISDNIDSYMQYDFNLDDYKETLNELSEDIYNKVRNELSEEISQQIKNNSTDEQEINKVFEVMGKAFIDFVDNANKLVEKYKLHKIEESNLKTSKETSEQE